MNTRSVNAAAGVIAAAMEQGKQLPVSLAIALDSAGLLNSPEHAAEFERMRSLLSDSRSADEDPIAYALTDKATEHCDHPNGYGPNGCAGCGAFTPADQEDVRPQVRKLRALLAGQRATVEDPHDSPLHHPYRLGRDLPEIGGAPC